MNNLQILLLGSFITDLVVAILFWPSTAAPQPHITAETRLASTSSFMQATESALLVTMYNNTGCICCTRLDEPMSQDGFFLTK